MIEVLWNTKAKSIRKRTWLCIIRIDPDAVDFNIFKEINKIHRHINQLTKQQTKKQTKKINN